MPGRQWSLQEEQYYWDHVVPHSRYRIGIDRATNLEQTWGDLAAQMQAALGSDARRDYTALGLGMRPLFKNILRLIFPTFWCLWLTMISPNTEEHFYLNVMQRGRSSRFARRFASRYHTQCKLMCLFQTNPASAKLTDMVLDRQTRLPTAEEVGAGLVYSLALLWPLPRRPQASQ